MNRPFPPASRPRGRRRTHRRLAALLLATLACGCSIPGARLPPYTPLSLATDRTLARAAGSPSRRPASRAIDPTQALGVERCVEIALRNHRGLRRAQRLIAIAHERVREAWSTSLPRLEAQFQALDRNNDAGVRSGRLTFVASDRGVASARLELVVPVYEIVAAAPLRKAARYGEQIARLEARRRREDVELAVRKAFYRVLEAQRILEVVDDSLTLLREQLEQVHSLHRHGLLTHTDVLSASLRLAEREQERIRAHHNLALARAALNRLLLRPLEAPLRLADPGDPPKALPALQSVFAAAIARRSDLASLRLRIATAGADYAYTRTRLGPQIALTGGYNYNSDSHQLNPQWWDIGVLVRLPIFDGGATWSRMRRKRKEIEQAIDLHDARADDVLLEVEAAWRNAKSAAEQIEVADRAVSLASRHLRETQAQLRTGVLTHTDVLAAEQRLSAARSRAARARYALAAARAELRHAIGGAIPQEDSTP